MQNVLLQPIEVGGQTFKNRIMFPPADHRLREKRHDQ